MDLKNTSVPDKTTLLLIMACLIFSIQVVSFFKSGAEAQKVNYIKKEITTLKNDVNQIYESGKVLDKKINKFNDEIENVHQAITINNTKIDNLKKDEKIKINQFKSYDARMWERYFADRYSKADTDTTK
jgi:peptidoglycan hydrolase CwlO-like protein